MLEVRRIPPAWFFLAVLCIASIYWAGTWAIDSRTPADQAVLFLPNGDSDYLPQVWSLAHLKFGETVVREMLQQGVRSFPIGSIFLHALMVRLFGSAGFVAAEILVFLLYGWALVYVLQAAGIGERTAELLALAVLSGIANWIVTALSRWVPSVPVMFWQCRFPRPGVSEIIVLLFLALALRLAGRQNPATGNRDWLLLGIVAAWLVQADLYQAASLGLGALLLAGYLIGKDPKRTLRGVAIAGVASIVCCTPFLYQRMHELPDVPRRWGMFSTGHHAFLVTSPGLVFGAGVVLCAGVWICLRSRTPRSGRMRTAMAVFGLTAAASLFAGPVSLFVLGKAIQIHHYRIAAQLDIGYVALLCCGWIVDAAIGRLRQTNWGKSLVSPRAAGAVFGATALACVGLAVFTTLERFGEVWWGRDQSEMILLRSRATELEFRQRFSELHAALERPGLRDADVLGTFDGQLANWWEYRGRHLYLPDIFNTTVSDQELEARVFAFLHLLETTPGEFDSLLENRYFLLRVLTGAKYQASREYTPWPLAEYSPASRDRIARSSVLTSTNLEVPLSERRRLVDAYERFNRLVQPYRRLDIVILTQGALRPYVHPEKSALRLSWRNDTFEIWSADDAANTARSRAGP